MDQWLIDLERQAFFSDDLGYVETCTYWDPTQDPSTDAGASVSATIVRQGREGDYENSSASTTNTATAVLNRGDVELVEGQGDVDNYGVLEDANSVRWDIKSIASENDAFQKVNLERQKAEHFGGLKARE